MQKIAIILTGILSLSACGGSTDNPSSPSGDVVTEPNSKIVATVEVKPQPFSLTGDEKQIAADLINSGYENRAFFDYVVFGGYPRVFSVHPSSTADKIELKISDIRDDEVHHLDLSISKGEVNHNVASINLEHDKDGLVGHGLLFPYGFLLHGLDLDESDLDGEFSIPIFWLSGVMPSS